MLQPRDDVCSAYDFPYLQSSGAASHTKQPIVTGTSVLAIKFKEGIVIAADNLASYVSLARFTNVHRLRPFNDRAIVGLGGDISDVQHLDRLLSSLATTEIYASDGHTLSAANLLRRLTPFVCFAKMLKLRLYVNDVTIGLAYSWNMHAEVQ